MREKKISDLNVNICFARDDDFDLRKAVERLVLSAFDSCD